MRDLYGVQPHRPARSPAVARSRPLARAGKARRATNSCRPRARACTRYPSGPVHAGIIEPGHFRFTANGETVVRLEERLGYVHKGVEGLMAGAEIGHGRAHRRAHLGRQHRGLCLGVRPRRRGRARLDAAATRGAAARRHGRARAAVAPHQRRRRDLQRRQRAHHPCPLHPAARGCAGRGRRLLRPSPDDGSRGAGRRGCRPVGRGCRARSAAFWRGSRRRVPRSCGSTIRCRRCRTAPSPPASSRPSSFANTPPAASSAAPRAAPSMRARPSPTRPTIGWISTSRCGPQATSMRVCWCAWTRSARASGCFPSSWVGWRRERSEPPGRRSMAGEGAALVEAFRGDVFVSVRVGDRRPAGPRPCARRELVPVAAARGGRSKATSLRTSRSATSRSIAPTRATTCEVRAMKSFLLDALRKGKATIAPPASGRSCTRGSQHGHSASAPASGWAARLPSARSMPDRATAASSKSTPSTIRSTTSSVSA